MWLFGGQGDDASAGDAALAGGVVEPAGSENLETHRVQSRGDMGRGLDDQAVMDPTAEPHDLDTIVHRHHLTVERWTPKQPHAVPPALPDEPGVVQHERPGRRIAEVGEGVVAGVVAHAFDVPVGGAQQPLDPVWGHSSGVLGQRPAVLAFQAREQPTYVDTGPGPRLFTHEPRPISSSTNVSDQYNDQPSRAALLLRDRRLGLTEIARGHGRRAARAYLSASHSALGDADLRTRR